jgi:hypothetical protein
MKDIHGKRPGNLPAYCGIHQDLETFKAYLRKISETDLLIGWFNFEGIGGWILELLSIKGYPTR